ncbi:MAG: hypothetical protein HY059_21620 [Proteobacteria bacterium]|nr:hypothetical protein [Pseudomonadota bacterium]
MNGSIHDDAAFEALVGELSRGETATLDRHFADLGLKLPKLVWDPPADAMPDAALRATHAHWQRLRRARAMPHWRELHVEELGVAVVHLAVVDPLPGTLDFRFAVYGSAIVDTALRDYRGETVCSMAKRAGTPGPLLYRAVYALARQRMLPAYTWNVAPPWQAVEGWHRLVLPFACDSEAGLRFLVCLKSEGTRAVPETALRDGERRLEFDPHRLR